MNDSPIQHSVQHHNFFRLPSFKASYGNSRSSVNTLLTLFDKINPSDRLSEKEVMCQRIIVVLELHILRYFFC